MQRGVEIVEEGTVRRHVPSVVECAAPCRLALRAMYDAVVGGACDLQPGVTLAAICEGVPPRYRMQSHHLPSTYGIIP